MDGTVIGRKKQSSGMTEGEKPGPSPTVSDEEILNLLREATDPVLSTAEIAEQFPLERRSIYDRLVSLRKRGELEGKNIGGRNAIWWLHENSE
jgi:predicted transcriptional regulator